MRYYARTMCDILGHAVDRPRWLRKPFVSAYRAGQIARVQGLTEEDNPYIDAGIMTPRSDYEGSRSWRYFWAEAWSRGWDAPTVLDP